GFVPDLQALQQPARFLQLRAHGGMAGIAADETRVALIEAHPRQGGRVDLHRPAVVGPPDEYIGDDILGRTGADHGAGTRLAGAHQRERAGELLVAGPQLPFHGRELPAGNTLEVMARDLDRRVEPGGRRIELPQLQLDALADRARADTRRVQGLNARKRSLDLGGLALDFGPQGVGDLLQRLRQVAIVADGVDDGARDRKLPRLQLRELELPEQIFLHRLTGGVGEFLLPVI